MSPKKKDSKLGKPKAAAANSTENS